MKILEGFAVVGCVFVSGFGLGLGFGFPYEFVKLSGCFGVA